MPKVRHSNPHGWVHASGNTFGHPGLFLLYFGLRCKGRGCKSASMKMEMQPMHIRCCGSSYVAFGCVDDSASLLLLMNVQCMLDGWPRCPSIWPMELGSPHNGHMPALVAGVGHVCNRDVSCGSQNWQWVVPRTVPASLVALHLYKLPPDPASVRELPGRACKRGTLSRPS